MPAHVEPSRVLAVALDALVARSHRDPVAAGSSCGCGDVEQTYVAAVTALARTRLPPGLLESVTSGPDGLRTKVTRTLTDEEARRVAQVMDEVRREIADRTGNA